MTQTLRIGVALVFGIFALAVALPVMAFALPFWAVGRLAAFLHYRLAPSTGTWQNLIEFFPKIGWKPKANLDTHALADDVFRVVTDGEGWRGKTSLDDSHLVVFGDSHGFGHGIDERHYFGNQTRSVRVKAVAANGYNMVQEVLWMCALESRLRDKLAVWFLFPGNDILDNLDASMGIYRSPFLRQNHGVGQWEIVTEHVQPAPGPFMLHRYRTANYDRIIKIYRKTSFSERAFDACAYLIREAHRVCRRAGAHLAVFPIPDPIVLTPAGIQTLERHGAPRGSIDPTLPDRELLRICQPLGIPLVAGSEHLTAGDYKEFDDHWNQRGHARVARILEDIYSTHAKTLTFPEELA